MRCINQHIPFLHIPTLDLNELAMPHLLAICAIGALYSLEKEDARRLHSISADLLFQVRILGTDLMI
jgi:hypothetical protein